MHFFIHSHIQYMKTQRQPYQSRDDGRERGDDGPQPRQWVAEEEAEEDEEPREGVVGEAHLRAEGKEL